MKCSTSKLPIVFLVELQTPKLFLNEEHKNRHFLRKCLDTSFSGLLLDFIGRLGKKILLKDFHFLGHYYSHLC